MRSHLTNGLMESSCIQCHVQWTVLLCFIILTLFFWEIDCFKFKISFQIRIVAGDFIQMKQIKNGYLIFISRSWWYCAFANTVNVNKMTIQTCYNNPWNVVNEEIWFKGSFFNLNPSRVSNSKHTIYIGL